MSRLIQAVNPSTRTAASATPTGSRGRDVTASCPAGTLVTGGGWSASRSGELPQINQPNDTGTTWQVAGDNGAPGTEPVTIHTRPEDLVIARDALSKIYNSAV